MTQNQIAFWSLKETQRANQARETETARHNVEQEAQGRDTVNESKRHNQATESFNLSQLGETTRHNIATEQYNISNLSEVRRHNYTTEQLSAAANAVNKWYNEQIADLKSQELTFAKEKELQRIEESQRDFNEAVRAHNLSAGQGAIDSASKLINSGANLAKVGATSGAAAAAGATAGQGSPLKKPIGKTFDLFVIPDQLIDLYMNSGMIKPNSKNSTLVRQ